ALDGLRALSARLTGDSADVCGFRAQYGVDCLGCGGTRAFGAAARGRFATAFRFNRLGAMIGLETWMIALAAALSLASGRMRFLSVAVVVALVSLPLTMAVHGVLWWRAL